MPYWAPVRLFGLGTPADLLQLKNRQSERKIGKSTTHGIVTSIDAYALSEDYELVEGEWIFQLWHEDKMLAEQKFTAYWPAEK